MTVDLKLVGWIKSNKTKLNRDEIIKRLKEKGYKEQDILDSYEKVAQEAPITTGEIKNILVTVILNLIIPGLGNIYLGRVGAGIGLLLMYILGWIFTFTLVGAIIGLPLLFFAWIIALITGVVRCNKINRGEV